MSMTQNFEETRISANFEGMKAEYIKLIENAPKTDFSKIDEKSPFLPGFYVIGALPSVGKTAVCLNLSANICKNGVPVLYISYEESQFVMASKDLARYWFLENYEKFRSGADGTPSASSIRRVDEKFKNYQEEHGAEYFSILPQWQKARENFYFVRGTNEPASKLIEMIKKYVKEKGVKFVVIDYLQIISPEQEEIKKNLPLRERIDVAVTKLREMQEETGITLLLISMLNRENYNQYASMESFKETGRIEYSADVLFVLQMKFDEGETRTKKATQDKFVEYPRTLELVCVKNRYGERYSAELEFFTRHDTFAKVGDIKIPKENRKTADNQQQENDDYDHE